MAIVPGLQPVMVARLSTSYPSAASLEISKKFRLDEVESLSPLIVVSKYSVFVLIVCKAEEDAGAGVQCMIAGGPEVQLDVTQSSTASVMFEIERPNLQGVWTSVFYSTWMYAICKYAQYQLHSVLYHV